MSLSRVGKQPITLPSGVQAELSGKTVVVKGPKGELSVTLDAFVDFAIKDGVITVTPKDDTQTAKARHGLMRALIANMVTGVSEGFSKTLEIHGVGYRANLSGKALKLNLGYSHDITFQAPEGVEIATEESKIIVKGINKQLVGQTAARIRAFRKPEAYKGKGIRYQNEYIIRKSGKTAA